MKKSVKDTVGHFKVLLDHTQRHYEPQPLHVLKRMVKPLCQDFERILHEGTKNDAWHILEGFVRECRKIKL